MGKPCKISPGDKYIIQIHEKLDTNWEEPTHEWRDVEGFEELSHPTIDILIPVKREKKAWEKHYPDCPFRIIERTIVEKEIVEDSNSMDWMVGDKFFVNPHGLEVIYAGIVDRIDKDKHGYILYSKEMISDEEYTKKWGRNVVEGAGFYAKCCRKTETK